MTVNVTRIMVPEKCSSLVPRVQHPGTKSAAMVYSQYTIATDVIVYLSTRLLRIIFIRR